MCWFNRPTVASLKKRNLKVRLLSMEAGMAKHAAVESVLANQADRETVRQSQTHYYPTAGRQFVLLWYQERILS